MDPKILENIKASLAHSAPVGPSSTLLSGSVYGSNLEEPAEILKKEGDETRTVLEEILIVNQSMLAALAGTGSDDDSDAPIKKKNEDDFSFLNAAIMAAAAGAIAFSKDIAELVESVKETFNNVKEEIEFIYDSITDKFSNLDEKFSDLGDDIVEGAEQIINEVPKIKKGVSDAFSKLSDDIVSVVKGEKSVSEVLTDDTVEFPAGSTAMGEGGMRGTALKVKQSKQKDELDRAKADLEEARAAGKTGKAITFRERNVAALQKDYDATTESANKLNNQVEILKSNESKLKAISPDVREKMAGFSRGSERKAEITKATSTQLQSTQQAINSLEALPTQERLKVQPQLQSLYTQRAEIESKLKSGEGYAPAIAKVDRETTMISESEREIQELNSQLTEQTSGGGVAIMNNTTSTSKNNIIPLSTSPRPGSKGSPLERHIGQSTVY